MSINHSDFKKHVDWVKVWSGRWSLLFDSHIGNDWTDTIKIKDKPVFKSVIYFYKNGITDCWVSQSEKDYLGERLLSLVRNDGSYVDVLCKSFKSLADEVTAFLSSHNPTTLTPGSFYDYWELISRYYSPHLCVKYLVDYLSLEELKDYLPKLEEARMYAEPIFRNTENFLEAFAECIANESAYSKEMILSTVKDEIDDYLRGKSLPESRVLKDRHACSALLVQNAKQELLVGKAVDEIEKLVVQHSSEGIIKGQIAYNGKVSGVVRIVIDPLKYNGLFDNDDILVTGMTRPEFLPIMKKASAIVTDAGGILSHAAITARELKKPCVIGTQMATKILKDGDMVEVDADNGIISIIKRF